jgi:hypothetical protein
MLTQLGTRSALRYGGRVQGVGCQTTASTDVRLGAYTARRIDGQTNIRSARLLHSWSTTSDHKRRGNNRMNCEEKRAQQEDAGVVWYRRHSSP